MSAIVPNLLRGNAWFSSKAAVTAAEHKVVEQCQDPSRCLIHENRSRPAVVVFIHLPKTGGTAVRTIFERSGWHLTLWSLSQRRFLRAIEDALISANQSAAQNGCRLNRPKRCAARVFVEWHLSPYNLSFVGTIEQRVRELRPDALFRSFLILRHPVQFVASMFPVCRRPLPRRLRRPRRSRRPSPPPRVVRVRVRVRRRAPP